VEEAACHLHDDKDVAGSAESLVLGLCGFFGVSLCALTTNKLLNIKAAEFERHKLCATYFTVTKTVRS
jgi:hypothetical protein